MTGANLYSRLLRYVRPYRWAFGLAVFGMMIVAAGDLMLAWLVIPIVRNFESPDPLGTKWLPMTIVGAVVDGRATSAASAEVFITCQPLLRRVISV